MKGLLQRLRTPEAFDRITRRWNQLQLLPIISILIYIIGGVALQDCSWVQPEFSTGKGGPLHDGGHMWWYPGLAIMSPYMPVTILLLIQSFMARQPQLVQRAILNFLLIIPVCVSVVIFYGAQTDRPAFCGNLFVVFGTTLLFASPIVGVLLPINYLYTRFARFEQVDT